MNLSENLYLYALAFQNAFFILFSITMGTGKKKCKQGFLNIPLRIFSHGDFNDTLFMLLTTPGMTNYPLQKWHKESFFRRYIRPCDGVVKKNI